MASLPCSYCWTHWDAICAELPSEHFGCLSWFADFGRQRKKTGAKAANCRLWSALVARQKRLEAAQSLSITPWGSRPDSGLVSCSGDAIVMSYQNYSITCLHCGLASSTFHSNSNLSHWFGDCLPRGKVCLVSRSSLARVSLNALTDCSLNSYFMLFTLAYFELLYLSLSLSDEIQLFSF